MYDIIKRYCENQYTNGLLLLDMPTGSGKTHSVVQYLFDAILDPTNKQKFFFTTTLKKNLPEHSIRKLFEDAGLRTQFEEKYLRIDSNYESVIAGFDAKIAGTIPFDIKKTDEYKSLEQYINLIKSLRKENHYHLRSALLAAEDSLRKDAEPKFRRMIQGLLTKNYFKVEDRMYAIKTNKDWQWVSSLYPSVFMRDRQLIFMTVDKFLSLNSTIVEPSTMLYNSDMIDHAVIFIDEFDATKNTVLNNIIQNGLRDRLDYVELFHAVHSVLHTHRFPTVLTRPSQKRLESQYKDQSLQGILDQIIKIGKEHYDTFSLQYSYRTETVLDETANNFLFQDHQYHSILNGNKSYITTIANHKERINWIRFLNERPEKKEGNIQNMLGSLRGFISFFMGAVLILAINYQQRKAEQRNPNEDEFTLEEAIRTVLAEFKLSNAYINYLTPQILMLSHKNKNRVQTDEFDLSFYEKGFRYYAFEDDYAHDMQSKIMMYSFQNTPEKLLLRFCEKAKVLGISATATIPSKIGNYDIEYLEEKLQDKYIRITNKERERLHDTFSRSIAGYENVNIHTEFIGGEKYCVTAWKQIANHDTFAQYLYDKVEQACSEDSNDYNKERYLRIATAFKSFLVEPKIQSFLCVLTKHPRKHDKTLNMDVLMTIFDAIVKFYQIPFNTLKNVVQLDGEEYDVKKDDIINRLGNGERLFVISVYQTIGAGQNLQYPVPESLKTDLVAINDLPNQGYKDFDAIYLDMPTNLLTQITSNLTEEDFVKYLFQIEMLQEGAEISVKDATAHIKKAFRCFSTKNLSKDFVRNMNDCNSVLLLSTIVIIQAIGRICRTNLKSKDIFVFADSRIVDRIDPSVLNGRIFNPEFTELVKKVLAVRERKQKSVDEELLNEAQLKSIRANKYIHNMLNEAWTDNRIRNWQQLRDMVLRYPTLSKEQFDDKGIAYNFYVEMPTKQDRIFYKQEDDFNQVQVYFSETRNAFEASALSSKLTDFMKVDFLKDYFETHGYATTFAENQYILSPPLFHNIYRGALGEVVGKALFSRYANVELIDITDNELFEKFDFIIPNSSVFVDFKNWHDSSYFESDQEMPHVAKKANDCGCKCVIIANMIAEGSYAIRKQTINGVEIVLIPALLTINDTPALLNQSWEEIRRCIREYTN